MKKLSGILVLPLLVSYLFAQNYTPSATGSAIQFSIKNFGLTVNGSFKGLQGKIQFNPGNPAAATIAASVEVTTVNTGNDTRDNHLKKEEYFNAAKYPLISFVSTKITGAGKTGQYVMEGKITIRGVTKNITFPFTAVPKGEGFLFEAAFKLNRRDFGVGGKSFVLSDKLSVSLSVLAN